MAKHRFEKAAILVKIQQKLCKCRKICTIFLNFAKFQKIQLDNLVDFEKCCKTRIYLQKSAPIQPKTSEFLPKCCQNLATTLRVQRLGRSSNEARAAAAAALAPAEAATASASRGPSMAPLAPPEPLETKAMRPSSPSQIVRKPYET